MGDPIKIFDLARQLVNSSGRRVSDSTGISSTKIVFSGLGAGEKMYEEFKEELGYKTGNKYIKITTKNGGSVWGFIVATDDHKKFKKGDILKAAGFNSPATNAARGNIFDDSYMIQWTGPLYLN